MMQKYYVCLFCLVGRRCQGWTQFENNAETKENENSLWKQDKEQSNQQAAKGIQAAQ